MKFLRKYGIVVTFFVIVAAICTAFAAEQLPSGMNAASPSNPNDIPVFVLACPTESQYSYRPCGTPGALPIVVNTQPTIFPSISVCATAPAVNATQAAGTCTITPPAGMRVYFNYLNVGMCTDGTLSLTYVQLATTTTNLGGWEAEFSWISGSTITTNAGDNLCQYVGGNRSSPLMSAAPGVAVTIVPPAQTAHASFPIIAEYYFAP